MFDIALQPQPVAVSRGKCLSPDESELTAVAVGNHQMPGQKVSRSEFENAAIFGDGIAWRQAGPVPIAGAKSTVPVPIHIWLVAQLAAEDRLQRGLDIKRKITHPRIRVRIAAGGSYGLYPDRLPFLNVDAEFGPELAACALGRGGNTPRTSR